MYIYWTVPPYTNSHHNPDQKKNHKHDGPKMTLRSWVGTFCQSTNPQRSCVFPESACEGFFVKKQPL